MFVIMYWFNLIVINKFTLNLENQYLIYGINILGKLESGQFNFIYLLVRTIYGGCKSEK